MNKFSISGVICFSIDLISLIMLAFFSVGIRSGTIEMVLFIFGILTLGLLIIAGTKETKRAWILAEMQ